MKQIKQMKQMKQMKQIVAAIAVGIVCLSNYAKASVTINADGGYFTSSGANIANGVIFFISNGGNTSFDSGVWANGATSILNSDDKLVGAMAITGGTFQGVLGFDLVGGISANQKLTGLFIAGDVASVINTATGSLIGSNTFLSTGGTSFNFGSYRTDSIESYGGPAGDFIAWVVPADGATVTLSVASGSGDYTGNIVAALGTTGTFNIGDLSANPIPEPSVASLLALGTVGLVALRVRRKS
jgi:hypothetical protein